MKVRDDKGFEVFMTEGCAREFSVMFKNEKVADVKLAGIHDTQIQRYTAVFYKQPFSYTGKNDFLAVQDFLASRCYENSRADLHEILEAFGLECNDPWRWVQISHGVTYDDFWWIRFPGETLTWEEVKIRE